MRRSPNPPSEDPEVTKAKSSWETADPYQRGDLIRPFRHRYTIEQLASEFGCTPKRIRDYELLGGLWGEERKEAQKLSEKKVLATLRERAKISREWKKETRGQRGRKLKNRFARLMREWLEKTLPPWMWDPFLQQVLGKGCVPFDVSEYGQLHWHEIQFDGNWQKVIEETEPPAPLPQFYMSSLFDRERQWFAAWTRRCMPFPEVCEAVCKRVRKELNRKAWKQYGGSVMWTKLHPRNPQQRKGLRSLRRRRSKKKLSEQVSA